MNIRFKGPGAKVIGIFLKVLSIVVGTLLTLFLSYAIVHSVVVLSFSLLGLNLPDFSVVVGVCGCIVITIWTVSEVGKYMHSLSKGKPKSRSGGHHDYY